jgi:lipopolysaccharide export system permease protein
VVITLVLVVDFVPDVVSMVVSKGLATTIVLQVFVLNLAWMLALSVPMAVLSGTLMAFGRLSGDSEILAAKVAGVSLYRMIAPVIVVGALLGWGLIEFNNRVLPEANHQARLLMSDISRKRPTLDLKPNVMEDRIPGYHLLIKEIDAKTSDIADVTIFEHKRHLSPRTVVARTGKMSYSADGKTLILELHDGEIHEQDPDDAEKHRKTTFEEQTFYLGGVGDEFSRTESEYRTDREKSSEQMRQDIKAWRRAIAPHRRSMNHACSTMVAALFLGISDSLAREAGLPVASEGFTPASSDADARQRALRRAQKIDGTLQRESASIANQKRLIAQVQIEIHKKYAIPVACVVFVLVGCPLGVLVRRGGMGVGMGVSLLLFLMYWAFLIGGEDLGDRQIISPFVAMWSADITIGTIGLLLLWTVANEVNWMDSAPGRIVIRMFYELRRRILPARLQGATR